VAQAQCADSKAGEGRPVTSSRAGRGERAPLAGPDGVNAERAWAARQWLAWTVAVWTAFVGISLSRVDAPRAAAPGARLRAAGLGAPAKVPAGSGPQGSGLTLTLPAWVGATRCHLERSGTVVAEREARDQVLPCPATGGLLRCDFGAAEPVDAPLADVCRTARLPLTPARRASVAMDPVETVIIQWLELAREGEVRLLATRVMASTGLAEVSVASRPYRFVRVVRAGAAPVTVAASELLRAGRWRVPPRQPGGEIVARIEAARVLPATYRLRGPMAVEVTPRDTWFAISGLRPGLYQVLPVYEGALTGHPMLAEVRDEDSTVVVIQGEAVGGVRLAADVGVCAQSSELRLAQVVERPGLSRPAAIRSVAALPAASGCEWRVTGLAPGRYRATLLGSSGTVVGADFQVFVQELTEVSLRHPGVTVSGRVRLNDRPLGDARIEFTAVGRPGRLPVVADVDAAGQFFATLPEPGRYHVRLLRRKQVILGQTDEIEVEAGPNLFDWALTGGSIALRIHGWDRQPRLLVRMILERPSTPQTVMFTTEVDHDDLYPSRFEGLAFGTYRVAVLQQDRSSPRVLRASREARVTLEPGHADATVDVELLENRAVLVVRDEAGAPVRGAQVTPVPSFDERSPGVFSLNSVARGTPLRIRAPGLVPTCRLAPGEGVLAVVLRRGRPVVLEFSRPTTPTPGYLLLDGSECPVPLSLFEAHALPPAHDGVARTRVENFPPAGGVTFLWMPTGERQALVVAEGDRVRIEIPGARRR
jgi:hypothetical protein